MGKGELHTMCNGQGHQTINSMGTGWHARGDRRDLHSENNSRSRSQLLFITYDCRLDQARTLQAFLVMARISKGPHRKCQNTPAILVGHIMTTWAVPIPETK